jgi:hypothetical protein
MRFGSAAARSLHYHASAPNFIILQSMRYHPVVLTFDLKQRLGTNGTPI